MQVGPFEVIEVLGRGGMGIVYRALQPSLNRIVALKVLPESLEGDRETVQRFRREAETAANLVHPNIVKVWDASLSAPPYYIAMEFLAGGTLSRRLAAGPMPVAEAVAIVTQIAGALDYAHRRGVVHRDVKPANIMFDEHGRAVITDFGIVRRAEQTRLTVDGSKMGTPEYMSPEQVRGQNLDRRSDLYSLAAVMYEMVTGRPPFVGDPLQVMYKVAHEAVPAPSQVRPGLPRALDGVMAKALNRDPGQRYQTGAEFVAAMRQVARVVPVPQPSAKPQVRPRRVPAQPRGAGQAVQPEAPTRKAPRSQVEAARAGVKTPPAPAGPGLRSSLRGALLVVVLLVLVGGGAWLAHQSGGAGGGSEGGGGGAPAPSLPGPPGPPGGPPKSPSALPPPPPPAPEEPGIEAKAPAPSQPPAGRTVPKVVGLTSSEARKKIEGQDLYPTPVPDRASSEPAGQVTRQVPEPGALLDPGGAVKIWFSDREAPEPVAASHKTVRRPHRQRHAGTTALPKPTGPGPPPPPPVYTPR
jgi:serine/threonine-protein kinase